MRIAICVPHYGPVHAKFSRCLAKLAARTARDHQLEIFFKEDGPLELKRTALVIQARGWNADYVQFIDTDQTFPRGSHDQMRISISLGQPVPAP